jgi:hypothetical protein
MVCAHPSPKGTHIYNFVQFLFLPYQITLVILEKFPLPYSIYIERWWRELHERLEKYFKRHLLLLKSEGRYNQEDDIDR